MEKNIETKDRGIALGVMDSNYLFNINREKVKSIYKSSSEECYPSGKVDIKYIINIEFYQERNIMKIPFKTQEKRDEVFKWIVKLQYINWKS